MLRTLTLIALCTLLSGCATIHRHPALTGAILGITAGTAIALTTAKDCDHYPPGHNGVNVPCPAYHKPYHGARH